MVSTGEGVEDVAVDVIVPVEDARPVIDEDLAGMEDAGEKVTFEETGTTLGRSSAVT